MTEQCDMRHQEPYDFEAERKALDLLALDERARR
jgi:hypothetical protein